MTQARTAFTRTFHRAHICPVQPSNGSGVGSVPLDPKTPVPTKRFGLYASVMAITAALLAQAAPVRAVAQPEPIRPAPSTAAQPNGAHKMQRELVVTGTCADVVAMSDRVSFSETKDLQIQTGTLADALRTVRSQACPVPSNTLVAIAGTRFCGLLRASQKSFGRPEPRAASP